MPYNPLDKKNLGKSVLDALLTCDPVQLSELEPVNGAGVYALYYRGDFPPYAPLKLANQSSFDVPIYVGKAIPKGGRKGLVMLDSSKGTSLSQRLRQHADSISAVSNLELQDFWCRFLVVDEVWIPLGESLTIQRFRPLWNQVIDGFGNKTPGAGRFKGARPVWDELHPGRNWAKKCAPSRVTRKQIIELIKTYFESV